MTQTTENQEATVRGRTRKAGAFDIRTFIAMLIGLYGVVLVVMGLVGTSAADLDRAGGFNVNLWAGVGMVAVAVVFQAWAKARPVIVPEEPAEAAADERDPVAEGSPTVR